MGESKIIGGEKMKGYRVQRMNEREALDATENE